MAARYLVGIDLGTTNSAAAYVDVAQADRAIRLFRIPQLVAAGEVEQRETLPSFHYEPNAGEFGESALCLPWETRPQAAIVGMLAKEQGAKQPDRLIASAKSWLSHAGVDRTAPILPWHGAIEVTRLTPAEANARYLAHLKASWNHAFPDEPLERQDIMLTVPASYDDIARALTVEAAVQAGMGNIVLLEEPQAAFYAWLARHERDWTQHVAAGQTILICDIGGGTTDLTLIAVEADENGQPALRRVRVGEHLILGGDNLDLALAHHVETLLPEQAAQLDVRQWSLLVRKCQSVKETLLSPDAPEELALHLPKTGSRLLQNAMQVTLRRDDARALLLDGFFPMVEASARPAKSRSGFQEFGLNYAADPAISRHLAAFLAQPDQSALLPDVVLLNGGFFKADLLAERMRRLLTAWSAAQGGAPPVFLEHVDLDLAVAYGAAYYGMVKRGEGIRITGGLPRSYYIGFESAAQKIESAICLIPAGLTEGNTVDITAQAFHLRIRQPVEFPLFVSQRRADDRPETIVPLNTDDLEPLPPLRTTLQSGKSKKSQDVAVHLHARLTEIGTLELWCSEARGERTWKLEFDTRAATLANDAHAVEQPPVAPIDAETLAQVFVLIRQTFDPAGALSANPDHLLTELERITGVERRKWPLSFLRAVWEQTVEFEACRRVSPQYEARWLNIAGFCLRPGYGTHLDDWRVQKMWSLLANTNVLHPRNQLCQAEWWILWRRISGGLLKKHQESLWLRCVLLLPDASGRAKSKQHVGRHEAAEIYRLAGTLELLNPSTKIQFGESILRGFEQRRCALRDDPYLWTLGHVGARSPMYGQLNVVLPSAVAEEWLNRLLALPDWEQTQMFPLVLLARKTGDRYRDISPETRAAVLEFMAQRQAPAHYLKLVAEVGFLDEDEQRMAAGDSLPSGLRIV